MTALIFTSIVIMIASLEHGYDKSTKAFVSNTAVNTLKVIGSILTVLLVILAIYHRIRIFRLRLAECQTTVCYLERRKG
jgi:hypothetical protein